MTRPYIQQRDKRIRELRYRRKNPLAPKEIVTFLGLSSESVVYNACRNLRRKR